MPRFAFIGFRHPHTFSLYQAVKAREDLTCVAACEEDADAAAAIKRQGRVNLTHDDAADLLANVDCDAIVIGDAFGRRGKLAIAALQAGRHVLSDKPLCTDLEELDQIEQLAHERGLSVGCHLDLRDRGVCITARRLLQAGDIGEVQTVNFTAQHPLRFGSRPDWYFQPTMHGGTINDIAVHAFDLIPWLTDRRLSRILAARTWNQSFHQAPHFQLGAQLMLSLDNQGGVLGDVSYLAPNASGYHAPQYWRFTFHGDQGVVELSIGTNCLIHIHHDDQGPHSVDPEPGREHGYLQDFLDAWTTGATSPDPTNPAHRHMDVSTHESTSSRLTTDAVFQATRWSLQAQAHADAQW